MKPPTFRIWNESLRLYVYGSFDNHGMLTYVSPLDGETHIDDKNECEIELCMDECDKNGKKIFVNDIVEVMTFLGVNTFVIKFGTISRHMDSGVSVDIKGFHFKPYGSSLPEEGYFSIKNNWLKCHDLEITEVVGNTHFIDDGN